MVVDGGEELLDALERSLQEVEALRIIYCGDDEEEGESAQTTRLVLKSSQKELDHARALVEASDKPLEVEQIPTIALEMQLQVSNNDEDDPGGTNSSVSALLYFGLGPGYPSFRHVTVTVLTAQGLSKTAQQDLVCYLQENARELIGAEAVMELVQMCQEQLTKLLLAEATTKANEQESTTANGDDSSASVCSSFGRRWIWVHHITDRQRKEDIVTEALDHRLGGFLKAGYPGIIVVEGPSKACDAFVMWVKGNKSRPGGFGRQWGHHVRGELLIKERQLTEEFVELEEDMSVLASVCRERALEDEFKTFVMQHG